MSNENYSNLQPSEAKFIIIGFFVLCPIGLVLSTIMITELTKQRKNDTVLNILYAKPMKYAMISLAFSLLAYLWTILFCSDVLIPWTFTKKNLNFVFIADTFFTLFYCIAKIAFYFSFTHYILLLFRKTSFKKECLMQCMYITCFTVIFLSAGYLIDDLIEDSFKEIGYVESTNLHVVMIWGHDGADYAPWFAIGHFLLDMFYFITLCVVYFGRLRAIQNAQKAEEELPMIDVEIGIKGLVLLIWCSLIFWIVCMVVYFGTFLRWICYIDLITNNICLYLLFKEQQNIYNKFCKHCDILCTKIIYHKDKYDELSLSNDQTDDEMNDL
eukprot:301207_1